MSLVEDQQAVLKDCIGRFDKLGVTYMLTGSMAMLHYSIGRMTRDIDIVIEVSNISAEEFIKNFENDYYIPQKRVKDAFDRRYMFNLLHQETVVKIDCVIKKDTEFQNQAFERRKKIQYGDFDVWTISKEDLILSKLLWAKDSRSEMQMRDVATLLLSEYDEQYVEVWAKKLQIKTLLTECKTLTE
jgi:hypothetical protein